LKDEKFVSSDHNSLPGGVSKRHPSSFCRVLMTHDILFCYQQNEVDVQINMSIQNVRIEYRMPEFISVGYDSCLMISDIPFGNLVTCHELWTCGNQSKAKRREKGEKRKSIVAKGLP